MSVGSLFGAINYCDLSCSLVSFILCSIRGNVTHDGSRNCEKSSTLDKCYKYGTNTI
jgi:hypothetical protein